jgi:hypothetical protein
MDREGAGRRGSGAAVWDQAGRGRRVRIDEGEDWHDRMMADTSPYSGDHFWADPDFFDGCKDSVLAWLRSFSDGAFRRMKNHDPLNEQSMGCGVPDFAWARLWRMEYDRRFLLRPVAFIHANDATTTLVRPVEGEGGGL